MIPNLKISENIKNIIDSSRRIDFNYDVASVSLEATRRNKHKEYIFNEKLSLFLADNCVYR